MMKRTVTLLAAAAMTLAGTVAFAGTPNDAEIAAIVVAANAVDVEAGKLAESMGSSAEVKAFGKRMVTDHTGVNQQAAALVQKLGVTPQENETSKALKAGGADNLAKLKKLKGAAFDKAYVAHEVAYHQAVLDTIDQTLVPNAKNAELKALIVKVRPAIEAHMKHAQQLQASLK